MARHDWVGKDFYKVLEVSEDANEKDITKAYRKLARKYHPDANPGDASTEAKFKEISEAYDVVGNSDRRKEYDELRKYGPAMGGFGGFGGGGGAGPANSGVPFDMGDLSDILGGLFGNRQGAPGARPAAGDDLQTTLNVSFDEAVTGVTTAVHLTADAACSECKGSGSAPGTTPDVCPDCQGRGVLDDNQGFFSMSRPCTRCGGRGQVITNPCSNCRATGIERKARQVKVRIPPGVKNGQKIRVKGRGGPGRYGGPPGDLFVVVNVGNHEMFGRKGSHLTIEVPVSYKEATLGANVKVPTFDGSTVTLKVPAGTPSGKTFRVKGKGIEAKSGVGDLLVKVRVVVPEDLSTEEQAAVDALPDTGEQLRAKLSKTG